MDPYAPPTRPWEPAPGARVAGRFALEARLGVGGMAEVWRAWDERNGARVALKLLRADHSARPEAVERLRREGALLASLSHPGIVRGLDVGLHEGGGAYVAMELLEGETLGARLRTTGALDPAALAPIVRALADGLAAAHARGVVHRDLKPDNVFLVAGAGRVAVKLLDFGISKLVDLERLTYTGEVLGTPRYMSPEQLGAEEDVDARADVYALGVIVYEALAGRPPFLGATPTDLLVAIMHGKVVPLRAARPEISAAVEAVVMRAMARARAARFASPTEFADAFVEAAGGLGPVPADRSQRTQALGGMADELEAAGLTAGLGAGAPERLSIGTLSEARPRASGLPAGGTSTPTAAPSTASPRGEAPDRASSLTPPMRQVAVTAQMALADAPPMRASAPSMPPRGSAPPVVDRGAPTVAGGRRTTKAPAAAPRWALVVVGVLAGALSAAVVVVAYLLWLASS